jgi:hypothetical protein
VAETFGNDASAFVAAPGKPVTSAAVNGGYINAGDPMGGMETPPATLIDAAMSQALGDRGFQPASGGTTPTVLIAYYWGEIRHDSFQLPSTNHLKGNDRARLRLVCRTEDAERIERDLVNDRYLSLKVGAMTRTEADRESLQLARDESAFVVVSAYDVAALREHRERLVWQVRLTTRAVGHSTADSLVTLVKHGAPYFGRDERRRQNTKDVVVPAASLSTTATSTPVLPAGIDAAFVNSIVKKEHAMWSGEFPKD